MAVPYKVLTVPAASRRVALAGRSGASERRSRIELQEKLVISMLRRDTGTRPRVITWRILYSCFSMGSTSAPLVTLIAECVTPFLRERLREDSSGTFQSGRHSRNRAALLLRAGLSGKQGARGKRICHVRKRMELV